MRLVIGGAFQGKKDYVKNTFHLEDLETRLLERNPQLILLSNELGYGVVPIQAFDRKYREATGRICTRIAAKSSQVIRVVCGIGTVIKNA